MIPMWQNTCLTQYRLQMPQAIPKWPPPSTSPARSFVHCDPSALARAQIPPCPSPFNAGHAGYSRPSPASYTLQPFIASESLLARLAYKSSSNFASGRVFVFFAAKASDRARAGPNYRNRKWEAKDFEKIYLLACYPFQISGIIVCCTTVLCFVTQRASPQRVGKVI